MKKRYLILTRYFQDAANASAGDILGEAMSAAEAAELVSCFRNDGETLACAIEVDR